jgi:acetoin utilization deacetylase AcuC-like enzyme
VNDNVTAYVGHGDCARHDPGWRHPDHQGRLPALTRALYRDTPALIGPLLQLEAVPAAEEALLRVHTRRHLDAVRRRAAEAATAGQTLELDGVPVSGASFDAAAAAAGTALTAADAVLRGTVRNAFCAARPPGRDALPEAGGGFSLFNTVAVAARHLLEACGVPRVLVVSWGTEPPEALTRTLGGEAALPLASVHAAPAEATGPEGPAPSAAARALAAGAGGESFGVALADAMDAAVKGAGGPPGFVLLSAGFDILAGDPRGRLGVLPEEVHALTRIVVERAEAWCGGRLVSVLEGGYAADATARAAVQHVRALCGLPPA